jgi:hypothetical protein
MSIHQLWIQPEGKQLCTAFNMLRKLCIHGIYVEFDLLWTINLLEAATSVEIFDVEVPLLFLFLNLVGTYITLSWCKIHFNPNVRETTMK